MADVLRNSPAMRVSSAAAADCDEADVPLPAYHAVSKKVYRSTLDAERAKKLACARRHDALRQQSLRVLGTFRTSMDALLIALDQ